MRKVSKQHKKYKKLSKKTQIQKYQQSEVRVATNHKDHQFLSL